MGKILKSPLKTQYEAIGLVVVVGLIAVAAFIFAPGIMVDESKELEALTLNEETVNNMTPEDKLPMPSQTPSIDANKFPKVTIAGYAWNGETPIITANGGPKTTKGSLMEANGVNLTIVRQDWLSELRTMQMKFIEEADAYSKTHNGNLAGFEPKSNKAAFAIMIMGDGAPFYISTMQTELDKKFGKGKWHVKVIACMGMSNGEDKLIGPLSWKTDPQSMRGALISTVPGDGDWVTTLNYCFANNIPVNPDFTTYDPNAVNIYPSENDDYINSAKELIKSQNTGWTVTLKEVKNGELTGKTVNKKIDGCATWTPGDKMVFDALTGFTDIASTADFPNQMATTIIAVDEWAKANSTTVENILKSTLTAANQIKLYDDWHKTGSEAVANTFGLETGAYWYNMFKGQSGSKGGIDYNMGGTRVLNYADAMQYYGLGSDGINRYRAVYDQVSTYLTELNPFDFNSNVDGIVAYDDAVNLQFLKNISNMVQTTNTEEIDYSKNTNVVMAQGQWDINFSTGSATIQATSLDDINTIYNLLQQAEQTKIKIIGYTDNTGDADLNRKLSDDRANSVADALLKKGISVDRFEVVEGKGEDNPIGDNNTAVGRAKNRRVEITLLK